MAVSTSQVTGNTTAPEVALLVVNWNGLDHLQRCLPSLLAQDYPAFQVVVVDNHSTDDSLAWLRAEMPAVRIVALAHNLGYGPALNEGLRATDTPLVAFLNNDVTLDHTWLRVTVQALESDPALAMVGSKLLYPDGQTIQHAGGRRRYPIATTGHFGYRERDEGQHNTPRDVDYVTGAAVLARRAALAAVGGFDDGFPLYFDEVDLCYRLGQAGARIRYLPTARGIHHESLTIGQGSANYVEAYHRGRLRFIFKHYTAAQLIADWVPGERASHTLMTLADLEAVAPLYEAMVEAIPALNPLRTAPPLTAMQRHELAYEARGLASHALETTDHARRYEAAVREAEAIAPDAPVVPPPAPPRIPLPEWAPLPDAPEPPAPPPVAEGRWEPTEPLPSEAVPPRLTLSERVPLVGPWLARAYRVAMLVPAVASYAAIRQSLFQLRARLEQVEAQMAVVSAQALANAQENERIALALLREMTVQAQAREAMTVEMTQALEALQTSSAQQRSDLDETVLMLRATDQELSELIRRLGGLERTQRGGTPPTATGPDASDTIQGLTERVARLEAALARAEGVRQ